MTYFRSSERLLASTEQTYTLHPMNKFTTRFQNTLTYDMYGDYVYFDGGKLGKLNKLSGGRYAVSRRKSLGAFPSKGAAAKYLVLESIADAYIESMNKEVA